MNTLSEFEYLLTKAQDRHFQETRNKVEKIYTKFLEKGDSSQHDHRDATSVGLRQFGYTPEGGNMHLDKYEPGTERVTTFKKYTLGLILPEELIDDMAKNKRVRDDKVKLLKTFSKDAAESATWTIETICTQFLTNATSTTATSTWPGAGRDSIALAGTHVTQRGNVTWVNLMNGSTLNPVALAEAVTMLENQPDETGKPQGPITEVIVIHSRYWTWRAAEMQKSEGQLDTANNNPNLIKVRNVKFRFIENPHLSETFKGFMVLAGGKHGLRYFMKQEPRSSKQTDVYTGNRIWRVMFRFAIDFFSARGVVYNPGL